MRVPGKENEGLGVHKSNNIVNLYALKEEIPRGYRT